MWFEDGTETGRVEKASNMLKWLWKEENTFMPDKCGGSGYFWDRVFEKFEGRHIKITVEILED